MTTLALSPTPPVPDRALQRPQLRELPEEEWPAALADNQRSGLSGFLGFEVLELTPGRIEARLELRDELLMAAGDFVHGGTVVAFADTLAGWGSLTSLPEGITGATTSELKVNFVATTRMPDALVGVATMLHGGRSSQVWDVTVAREGDGRIIAHYRCTLHLLAPRG